MREPDPRCDYLANAVIGVRPPGCDPRAAIEVHRELGPGFLESVYEDALAVELGLRKIPFERQPTVEVRYKGIRVGEG